MATGNRGVFAETKVKDYLKVWQAQTVWREANRLTDAKAAGRIIKAAPADFEYFCLDADGKPVHGLIEVKETEHDYRLARDKVPQLPHLRKREKCGGVSVVLVYHSKVRLWRSLGVPYLADHGDKGSWNLTQTPAFGTAELALRHFSPMVFSPEGSSL